MNYVLLAVFDSEPAALEARARLLSAGFADDAVAMAGRDAAPASGTVATDHDGYSAAPQSEGGIARFFLEHLLGPGLEAAEADLRAADSAPLQP